MVEAELDRARERKNLTGAEKLNTSSDESTWTDEGASVDKQQRQKKEEKKLPSLKQDI